LVRFTVALALAAGLAWLARRALIRWVDGPSPEPSSEPWPEVPDTADLAPASGRAVAEHGPQGGSTRARIKEPPPGPPLIESSQTVASHAGAPAQATNGALPQAWVEPGPDGCPESHPVKAKVTSMIYHLPGMLAYSRTRPDRCYADPEAAEADGFVRAKR
jgi:hypothetical protein